jgi:hypothetical protein
MKIKTEYRGFVLLIIGFAMAILNGPLEAANVQDIHQLAILIQHAAGLIIATCFCIAGLSLLALKL